MFSREFGLFTACFRRPCGFDLVFLEQTVSLIADEDAATQYLMQVRASVCCYWAASPRVRGLTRLPVQVLVRWKSKLHLGKFWVLEASGKRWRTQTFMLRVRVLVVWPSRCRLRCPNAGTRTRCSVLISTSNLCTGSGPSAHVAQLHNECAAAIRPGPTRGEH